MALGLLLTSAACGDDADDETSPTTTSPSVTEATTEPADEPTTTTTGPDETTASEPTETTDAEPGAIPGDDADVLTAEQAQAQMEALLAAYRQGMVEARAANAVDERLLRSFSAAFTDAYANAQFSAVQTSGAAAINPTPSELTVSDVEVTSTTGTCAAGTAVVEGIETLIVYDPPLSITQPFYFRLEPAADGADAPAWRIAFLNISSDGIPLQDATCG